MFLSCDLAGHYSVFATKEPELCFSVSSELGLVRWLSEKLNTDSDTLVQKVGDNMLKQYLA